MKITDYKNLSRSQARTVAFTLAYGGASVLYTPAIEGHYNKLRSKYVKVQKNVLRHLRPVSTKWRGGKSNKWRNARNRIEMRITYLSSTRIPHLLEREKV